MKVIEYIDHHRSPFGRLIMPGEVHVVADDYAHAVLNEGVAIISDQDPQKKAMNEVLDRIMKRDLEYISELEQSKKQTWYKRLIEKIKSIFKKNQTWF